MLLSYDFANEPRRWQRIEARYAPVEYLAGNAEPGEIASLAAFLCGEPAGFQTGTLTLVDGGLVRAL